MDREELRRVIHSLNNNRIEAVERLQLVLSALDRENPKVENAIHHIGLALEFHLDKKEFKSVEKI